MAKTTSDKGRKFSRKKELLRDLEDKFNASLEHPAWQAFGENAPKDFRYKEGDQWTTKERKDLEDRGQAATTENEIKPIIDRLIGQHKRQKGRIIYRGRNLGDDDTSATLLTDLALHIHQRSEYEFEEGDCFDNGVTCGFGCLETKVTFDDALQPEILTKNTESLDIYPDPQSKCYNWNEDADFIHRAKWMPLKKAQAMYPHVKQQLASLVTSENQQIWTEREDVTESNYVDDKNQRVRIIETWWKKYTKRKLTMETNKLKDVTKATKKELKGKEVFEKIETRMMKSIWAFSVLIENGKSPYNHDLFPFTPYFIYRKKNGEPYSLVRQLIDPQDEINKRRSKALHHLQTNQAIFEEGGVRDKDLLKKELSKPDGIIEYRRGYQFQLDKNVEVAQTQMQFQQESKMAMPRVAGISDEAMGKRSEIRSGIGLQRKQLMTDIIVTPIFDNLRRTRKMKGTLEYELIKQYYTEEKEFLITDEQDKQEKRKLDRKGIKAIQEGIYDVIVEEAPDTTTIQDEQFEMISQTLQGLPLPPAVSTALLPILFQASQLRGKQQIVEQLQAIAQQPPTEQPKMTLNLAWANLTAVEKAAFASMMGQHQLAEYEMKQGIDGEPPEKETAKERTELVQ
jgi:hypothetical protein